MNSNFLTDIGSALVQMFAANAGMFLATGVTIYWLIVAINIFMLGLDSYGGKLTMDHFVRKTGMILIVGTILGGYSTPLLGVAPFPHIIIDEAKSLSDRLEGNAVTAAHDKLNQSVSQIEQPTSGISLPTIGSIVQAAWFWFINFLLAIERVVLIGILAVSYEIIGVIVLMGPMFIPWILFPGLEHIAWGWFNALLQFCFYQVVGGAAANLNSLVLLGFFAKRPLPWALADVADNAMMLVVVVVVSMAFVFMVPRVASAIMGGAAISGVRERAI